MKAVKPFKLGLLTRPFELKRAFYLGVTAIGWSPLALDGVQPLLPEPELWEAVGEDLGPVPIDAGLPKSRGEVLLTGKAYAPGGEPVPTVPVRVRVGDVDKSIYVVGDRVWNEGVPTAPEPFSEMELTWERAFGGPGYEPNPLGRGMPIDDEPHRLPNLELPGEMVDARGDRPPPACFGPIDPMWPPRSERTGTYDDVWLHEHYPGFPPDFDWRHFQIASDDQHNERSFRGDEEYELLNLHPSRPKITGRLPGVIGRAFLRSRGAPEHQLEEVPLKLTTVWFFPHRERILLLWQGAASVTEDDAWDVEDLVLAADAIAQPRPKEHFESILALRTRRDVEGSLAVLKDSDLLPPGCDDSISQAVESQMSLTSPQGYMQANAEAKLEREMEEARAKVAAQGLDPDQYGPPPPPPRPEKPTVQEAAGKIDEVREQLIEAEKQAKAKIEAMQAQLRAGAEEADVDFDAIANVGEERTGPPTFDADEKLREMQKTAADARAAGAPLPDLEAKLADERFVQGVREAEAGFREGYRLSAHEQEGLPARLEGEAAAQVRAEVEAAVREGRSLRGRDLTGADLSGMDLSGGDFTEAFLENASFAGATLRGVALDLATLAHADLSGADLTGATLVEANLGDAVLRGAKGDGVDATGAILHRSDWTQAQIRGLKIGDGFAMEARFDGAVLPGLEGSGRQLYRCSLKGAQIPEATLEGTVFLEMSLTEVSFAGAKMEKATFYQVRADHLDVTGAELRNARFVGECSLHGLKARGALLDEAFLREVPLTGADFTHASMARIDLSHCDLRNSRLDGAHAREARLIRANLAGGSADGIDLMGAMLGKADLTGTSLRGANLFGADFARARSDGQTNLDGANTAQVRVQPVASS